MAELSLAYVTALLQVAPSKDLIGAALRRLRPAARPPRPPIDDEIDRASWTQPPRLFSSDDPAPLYRAHFPEAPARFRSRAQRILDGEAEIFGVWRRPDPDHPDPKLAWEAARGGHLVELAAAARLHPELAQPVRALISAQIAEGLERRLPPLEVAIRGLHWLAALELAGETAARQGLARSLLM